MDRPQESYDAAASTQLADGAPQDHEDAALIPDQGLARGDEVVAARDVVLGIDVLRNDSVMAGSRFSVEIGSKPKHGTVSVNSDRSVTYWPQWHFTGVDFFTYRLTSNEGLLGQADVRITITNKTWMQIGNQWHELDTLGESAGGSPELDAVRVDDLLSDGQLLGARKSLGVWHAVAGRGLAALARFPIPFVHAQSWLHHGDSLGGFVGSAHVGKNLIGLVRATTGDPQSLVLPQWRDLELFGVHAGVLVGTATPEIGQMAQAVALERAVDCKWISSSVAPPGSLQSGALGMAASGTVVGWYESATLKRSGFARSNEIFRDVAPQNAKWSEAWDIDDALNTVVGSYLRSDLKLVGFAEVRRTVNDVSVPSALATRVRGIGPNGDLVGDFDDGEGLSRGYIARLLPAIGTSSIVALTALPEPVNADIAHACDHSVLGPFQALGAVVNVDNARAPWFSKSHTSYSVDFPDGVPSGRIEFRATGAGELSLFVRPPLPLRLRAEDGTRLEAQRMEMVSRCPGIEFLYQFSIPKSGSYSVELGPTDAAKVSIVLEKSWVYP